MSIDVFVNDVLVGRQKSRINFETGATPIVTGGGVSPIDAAIVQIGSRTPPQNFVAGVWPTTPSLTLGVAYGDTFTAAGTGGLAQTIPLGNGEIGGASLYVWWEIVTGVGSHTIRLIDAANPANVLAESGGLFTGRQVLSVSPLPGWVSGAHDLKLQVKSTVALGRNPTLRCPNNASPSLMRLH